MKSEMEVTGKKNLISEKMFRDTNIYEYTVQAVVFPEKRLPVWLRG